MEAPAVPRRKAGHSRKKMRTEKYRIPIELQSDAVLFYDTILLKYSPVI